MTPAEIRAAIEASPELQALANARNDGALAAALSIGRTKVSSKLLTARGLASAYPGGPIASEVVLMKLEGSAVSLLASADAQTKALGSLLKRQLGFLAGDGLDFGDAALRAMLDYFASLSIVSATEAANLKALALTADPVPLALVSAVLNEEV